MQALRTSPLAACPAQRAHCPPSSAGKVPRNRTAQQAQHISNPQHSAEHALSAAQRSTGQRGTILVAPCSKPPYAQGCISQHKQFPMPTAHASTQPNTGEHGPCHAPMFVGTPWLLSLAACRLCLHPGCLAAGEAGGGQGQRRGSGSRQRRRQQQQQQGRRQGINAQLLSVWSTGLKGQRHRVGRQRRVCASGVHCVCRCTGCYHKWLLDDCLCRPCCLRIHCCCCCCRACHCPCCIALSTCCPN